MVAAIKKSLKVMIDQLEEGSRDKVADTGELKKMTLEKWKEHVKRGHAPFNRRCRVCMQEAGIDRPHRRLKADIPAYYVLNVDIAGPFSAGDDAGTGRKVKYALIGTVPVPLEGGEGGDPPAEPVEDADEDVVSGEWEEEDEQPRASDDEARRLNEKVKDEMAEALKGVKVQNVTMTEVMETRSATEVIRALNLIFVKYRSLGIPLYRMRCDRAKEFLSKQVQHWCLEHNLLLTMTSGDDHAANGRVETEVNHVKRRLRVVLKGSGAPAKWWPAALRHVVLQRNQQQLERFGVETFPLLPFYAKVMVKTKRWHKKGPLASPFREVRLLGPSPLMSWGWVVQTNEGTI